jgi:hypothetical protein
MVHKGVSEMRTGVWRIKWHKYRYALVGALILNLLLIDYFFDLSVSNLRPLGEAPIDDDLDISNSRASSPPKSPGASISISPTPSLKLGKLSKSSDLAAAPLNASLIPEPPAPASIFNLNDYDFNGEYIGWPLERVCNETKYQPGLIFVCDNNSGGIGNIRNFILTCIRYAIDSGATGIITPKIQRRSEEELANLFTTTLQHLDYFFDEQHFRYALGTCCSQLAIYNTTEDIPNSQKKTEIKDFYPKDLNHDGGGGIRGISRHLDMYRTKFDA